jgi:hypothetical protein
VKNEEYRGTHPFSEPETRFVRDVAIKWKIDAYMSMHTGAQVLWSAFLSRRVYMSGWAMYISGRRLSPSASPSSAAVDIYIYIYIDIYIYR